MQRLIDLKPIKRLASKLLNSQSIFRKVIIQEENMLSAKDYCVKLETWLLLLEEELRSYGRSDSK